MAKKNKYNRRKKNKTITKSTVNENTEELTNIDLSAEEKEKEKVIDYLLDDVNDGLTLAQIDFVNQYLKTGNATQSYRDTIFKTKNISESSIRELASRELKKYEIINYMKKIKKAYTISKFDFKLSPTKFIENMLVETILDDNPENNQSRIQAMKEYARLVKENVIVDSDNVLEFEPYEYDSSININIYNQMQGVDSDDDKFDIIRNAIRDKEKEEIIKDFDLSKLTLEELSEIKDRIESKNDN